MTDPAPPDAPARPAGRSRALRLVSIQFVVWPLALAAAEGLHRAALAVRGTPYHAAEARGRVRAALARVDAFVPRLPAGPEEDGAPAPAADPRGERLLHPFTGYDTGWGQLRLHEELAREPVDGEVEVLVVGGSAAQLFAQHGTERLTRLLRADPRLADAPIRYLHFARGGFKQPQQLHMVTWLLALGLEPEVVLCLDGFNEVALANQNATVHDTHPVYPSIGHWGHLARGSGLDEHSAGLVWQVHGARLQLRAVARGALDRGPWMSSSLLGRWTLARVARLEHRIVEGQERYARHVVESSRRVTRGPLPPGGLDDPLAVAVAAWAECARTAAAVCRDRGMLYLHVLQPTLWDPGAKPVTAEEERVGTASDAWRDGVRDGYPRLRAAGAALASCGVPFVDASRVFEDVDETLYVDSCHVNARGNELLAERIAPELLRRWPGP